MTKITIGLVGLRLKRQDIAFDGEWESEFTRKFASYMGGGYADAVNSGTSAVYCALAALELPKHSVCLVSPFTDPGTVGAIAKNGLVPRLIDTDHGKPTISLPAVEAAWDQNVSVILLVHPMGYVNELSAILDWARKRGIPVVEDCAQVPGGSSGENKVGAASDISAFSTMFSKTLHTGGTGGLVFTKSKSLIEKVQSYADRGKQNQSGKKPARRDPETNLFASLNLNANELSCLIGLYSLRNLERARLRRVEYASVLSALVNELDEEICLIPFKNGDSPFVIPLKIESGVDSKKGRRLARALDEARIPYNREFKYFVGDWPWARELLDPNGLTENAKRFKSQIFTLYVNERFGRREANATFAAIETAVKAGV